MNVAIIPARGGSKRIPRKNIKPFAGKPMIAYSIEAALESGLFERVIVSTDDREIADVARGHGAEVPFIRPAELADDFAGTDAVLLHGLQWLEEHARRPDYCCCIYATAPFVRSEYLRQGFELLCHHQATSAFSVATFPACIFRALKLNDLGRLEMIWPENREKRSQDLGEAYHDAGQFYWVDTGKYLAERRLFSADAVPVQIPRHLVQDIDTPEDWETAERMYRALCG
ncbi:pseudaminic acid cytidylyltransferase [Geotalea uraniireducens]|uniref:Pseudaminic acid cytidylyltransferase n=1 Tax=Geotalea uraniireducens TaxID=351604 RepID=A0ABM8ELN5_9BACT|nr:pseudaminic acid cytidylyltransferase [Geotalea uraniireducens]BDV43449.1 pseudaminic acid cytidylyltransferase [Geotalea uraniireducens]BDV44423.1 pseudaminic acid cytidylyltransferase [Geotalea uraniireducens]